jgi:hypothetical protein
MLIPIANSLLDILYALELAAQNDLVKVVFEYDNSKYYCLKILLYLLYKFEEPNLSLSAVFALHNWQ